ncbi:MAG: hypothetical protein AAF939_19735 [Planctomycetota bacterium]
MKRFVFSISTLIFLTGCNPEPKNIPTVKSVATSSATTQPVEEDNVEPTWRRVDSNEWYDHFELVLTDSESITCAAFHKTDAQLGIGIAFQIAILADDRKFKFFTFNEASPTQNQMEMLEPLLPKSRVLESYSLIKYFESKPKDTDPHAFDVEFMTQMRRDQPDEIE